MGEVEGGGGRGRATWTKWLDEPACADHTTRTAPLRGRCFMQGHWLEQAAQEGPDYLLGALAIAPRREPVCRAAASSM